MISTTANQPTMAKLADRRRSDRGILDLAMEITNWMSAKPEWATQADQLPALVVSILLADASKPTNSFKTIQ